MTSVVGQDLIRALGGFLSVPRFLFRLPLSQGARLLAAHVLTEGWRVQPRELDQADLARELDMTPRRLRACLAQLADQGVVQVVRRGQGRSNLYIFAVPESALLDRSDMTDQESPDRSDMTALERSPSADPSIEETKKKTKESSLSSEETKSALQDLFEAFWKIWPRKVAKKNAERAYRRAVMPGKRKQPDTELAKRILSAVTAQSRGWSDPQYIPHPATWLNGERWEDQRPEDRGSQPQPAVNGSPRGRVESTLSEDDPYAGMDEEEKFYAQFGDRIE